MAPVFNRFLIMWRRNSEQAVHAWPQGCHSRTLLNCPHLYSYSCLKCLFFICSQSCEFWLGKPPTSKATWDLQPYFQADGQFVYSVPLRSLKYFSSYTLAMPGLPLNLLPFFTLNVISINYMLYSTNNYKMTIKLPNPPLCGVLWFLRL